MARITNADVTAVMSTTLTGTQIDAFIADIEIWVTEELAPLSLSVDRLTIIEKYLVCAFVRLRDLGLKSTTLDTVSESYQVDPQVSDYLLRAAGLDPTGTVRKQFIPAPGSTTTPVKFATGTTFTDERLTTEGL